MPEQAGIDELLSFRNILLDVGDTLVHITEPFEVYTRRAIGYLWDQFDGEKFSPRQEFIQKAYEVRAVVRKAAHQTIMETHIHDFFRKLETSGLIDFQENYPAAELAYIQAELEITEFYQDVIPFLERVSENGNRLVVATNNFSPAHVHALMDLYGMAPYMDSQYISAEIGFRKPHPGFVKTILGGDQLDPSETLIIGDKIHMDIDGGIANGIHTCLIRRKGDFDEIEGLERAEFILTDLPH